MRKYKDRKHEHRKYGQIFQEGILLTVTTAVAFIMYYFCRVDDSDALLWILTPTARWAGVLGGIPFAYLPHQGYVNYLWQFVIAPSCAGCRFMLIAFLMMVFMDGIPDAVYSCEARTGVILAIRKRWLWFGCSLGLAYFFTIFVNGIRIVASIYLPFLLERKQLISDLLTPDSLHTLIGTGVYFISLCVIYLSALSLHGRIFDREKWSRKNGGALAGGAAMRIAPYRSLTIPVFWYLLFVLVLPFVKRAYHHDLTGFGQYAAVIGGVCGSVCGVMAAGGWFRKRKKYRDLLQPPSHTE